MSRDADIRARIDMIANSKTQLDEKIMAITTLREDLRNEIEDDAETADLLIENSIEDLISIKLRELDAIREKSIEYVSMEDIDLLKDGYAELFKIIDNTMSWNEGKRVMIEGVINRASLRAMLIDPSVSVKTKEEILNNWEDFM